MSTIISIVNAKGGTGKTTTALQLAVELEADAIIDLDNLKSIAVINEMRAIRGKETLNVLTPTNSEEFFHIIDNHNGVLIIDCGGYDDDLNAMAVAAADIVICPSNDDVTEKAGLYNLDKVLERISKNTGKKIIGHVLPNKMHHARTNYSDYIELVDHLQHLRMLESIIPTSSVVTKASTNGLSANELNKHCSVSRAYVSLSNEIVEILTAHAK